MVGKSLQSCAGIAAIRAGTRPPLPSRVVGALSNQDSVSADRMIQTAVSGAKSSLGESLASTT